MDARSTRSCFGAATRLSASWFSSQEAKGDWASKLRAAREAAGRGEACGPLGEPLLLAGCSEPARKRCKAIVRILLTVSAGIEGGPGALAGLHFLSFRLRRQHVVIAILGHTGAGKLRSYLYQGEVRRVLALAIFATRSTLFAALLRASWAWQLVAAGREAMDVLPCHWRCGAWDQRSVEKFFKARRDPKGFVRKSGWWGFL